MFYQTRTVIPAKRMSVARVSADNAEERAVRWVGSSAKMGST